MTSDGPSAQGFQLGPWQQIADGVFVLTAEPAEVNLGLVVGRYAALLIDTGSSADQGAELRASITGVTDRPLTAVVLTHGHYDHAYGLDAFADLPTIAHESVREQLDTAGESLAVDGLTLGVPRARPTREIVVATSIDLGDRRVEIAHLGEGHTAGDLIVVVPDADVLFVGDLLESAGPPSFGPDAVPDSWAATLDGVIGLMTGPTRAVPGHGHVVDREFVFEQRGRIAAHAAGLRNPEPAGVQPGERPALPLV